MNTIASLLSFVAVLKIATATLTITSKPQETQYLNQGSNVTFPCTVSGGDYSWFGNVIVWYKVAEGNSDTVMNQASIMTDLYRKTNRMSISGKTEKDENGDVIHFPLTINDISLADNGSYRCELKGEDGVIDEQSTNVIVPAKIDELVLTVNSSRSENNGTDLFYEFNDSEPSYVSCRSTGGNPIPFVRMFKGQEDISVNFETKLTEIRTGEKGLEVITFQTEMTNTNFEVTHEDNGEKLKCIGRIHKMPETKKTVTGTIDVKYAPRFDCKPHRAALPGTKNFKLDCKIKSNPMIDLDDIMWTIGHNNATNITAGETRDGYTANFTEDLEEGDAVHVFLRIHMINTTDYQKYSVRVRNDMGVGRYDIHLAEATTTTSTTTTTAAPIVVDLPDKAKPIKGDGNGSSTITANALLLAALLFFSNSIRRYTQ